MREVKVRESQSKCESGVSVRERERKREASAGRREWQRAKERVWRARKQRE